MWLLKEIGDLYIVYYKTPDEPMFGYIGEYSVGIIDKYYQVGCNKDHIDVQIDERFFNSYDVILEKCTDLLKWEE